MEFNKIERIAITSILIGMMNVDNDVDLREVLYFNQIQNTIGITQEEFEQGKEQNKAPTGRKPLDRKMLG